MVTSEADDMTTSVPPGSVVVAVDAHDTAPLGPHRALGWALDHAAREGRDVDLVHAVDVSRLPAAAWLPGTAGPADRGGTPDRAPRPGSGAEAGLAEVAAACQRTHPGVQVRWHVVEGDPRESLTAMSDVAHLLVLGSHGRGVLGSRLLGSVASAVVRRVSCPAVVVRPGPHGLVPAHGHGVVVGIDAFHDGRPVVDFAFRFAELHALPLTVVHTARDLVASYLGVPGLAPVGDSRSEREQLVALVADLCEAHRDVDVVWREGLGVLDLVLEHRHDPWDLVVVGRVRHGAWHRVVPGAATSSVLEHCTGPVALVPEARSSAR